ncbi:bifunctional oligoribonuclease/PAP phosphatase NrnA [Halosolutus amylolyticus]|uniref:Bifunctional oligoribonuclease/PAP phosphatase NrnA n=1 Tax=Halosolutus amylolyticus TaxID=2932267 RepID=A0ABD5PN62_9EURY|nr:bifunctional oligoribonuclease/PAP phosphatase NrnA [Halosolutus amylolyticus]
MSNDNQPTTGTESDPVDSDPADDETIGPESVERSRADRLVELLDGTDSLAIVCHDNPDPDCLASALALKRVAEYASVWDVEFFYGGEVTHPQNRVFVNLLDIDLQYCSDAVADYDRIALVDCSIPGRNNSLDPGTDVDIVIDHHPGDEPPADFVDVREEYSSTTTIIVEYHRALDLPLDADLATALLFAIRRETLDFLRNVTEKEYEAALYLHPFVDLNLLKEMNDPPLSEITVDAIASAIQTRTVQSAYLVATVGRSTERDTLPQAADYLLNLEGVQTVLVFGITGNEIHASARSTDSRVDLADLLEEVFGDVGSAGGHEDMAAAQIPLGLFADVSEEGDDLIDIAARIIERRFFRAAGYEDKDIPKRSE